MNMFAMDNPRVRGFIEKIGPKLSAYLEGSRGCVAPLGSGGKYYGLGVYTFLTQDGKDVIYLELEKGKPIPKNQRQNIGGRRIIVVDDAIATGETYREMRKILDEQKESLGVEDIVFAVEHDFLGIADFAASVNGDSKNVPDAAVLDTGGMKK